VGALPAIGQALDAAVRIRDLGSWFVRLIQRMFGPDGAVHPHENWRLVSTERPGVELVVSAHKSVALLGVLGRADDSILDAERDATGLSRHLDAPPWGAPRSRADPNEDARADMGPHPPRHVAGR
jgi:hypothetical protein